MLEQQGRDSSTYPVTPLEAMVFCESTEDVAAVLKLPDAHAVPVIAFGVDSSLEGHPLAVQAASASTWRAWTASSPSTPKTSPPPSRPA